jgi:hypothetical protein
VPAAHQKHSPSALSLLVVELGHSSCYSCNQALPQQFVHSGASLFIHSGAPPAIHSRRCPISTYYICIHIYILYMLFISTDAQTILSLPLIEQSLTPLPATHPLRYLNRLLSCSHTWPHHMCTNPSSPYMATHMCPNPSSPYMATHMCPNPCQLQQVSFLTPH